MNNRAEMMWKEVAVAKTRQYYGFFVEKKGTKRFISRHNRPTFRVLYEAELKYKEIMQYNTSSSSSSSSSGSSSNSCLHFYLLECAQDNRTELVSQ